MNFFGSHSLAVDDKGRIVIPKVVRDELMDKYQGELFMGQTFREYCISIYPKPVFERYQTELVEIADATPKFRRIYRNTVGTAQPCKMQANGRVLVPKELRNTNGIVGNAVLVNADPRLELWSEANWQEQIEKTITDPDDAYLPYLEKITI